MEQITKMVTQLWSYGVTCVYLNQNGAVVSNSFNIQKHLFSSLYMRSGTWSQMLLCRINLSPFVLCVDIKHRRMHSVVHIP